MCNFGMLIGLAIRWYMTKSRLQARQDTDGAYEPTCGGNSTASALTPQNAFLGYTESVNNAIVAAAGGPSSNFTTAKDAVDVAYTTINSSLTDISAELKAIDLGLDGFKDTMGSAADGILDGMVSLIFDFSLSPCPSARPRRIRYDV